MLTLTKIYAVKTGQPRELMITKLLKLIYTVLNRIRPAGSAIQIISIKSFAGVEKLD